MGSPDWQSVEQVLDQALDLAPEEWAAFLDRRCSGQPELRLEVESLLQASTTPDTLLDHRPRIMAQDLLEEVSAEIDSDGFTPGDRIDRYEVVRLLGRGGQGSVYLAQRSDGVFDKQVAVKVVKRGMVTEDVLARFRDERQILADLEHPNIAGILDGGVTQDGLPYLVMELAEGEPIDDYCDRQQLPVPKRLELFIAVCQAVHYAHRNLVIHRDLKPGNILVTPDGTVKLLDFGIARVMEPYGSGFRAETQAAIPRLTPEYAAPEQVLGTPMTTATDVYALGVVLYELLCGIRPYEIRSRSLMAVQQVICGVDPKTPSRSVEEASVEPLGSEHDSIARDRSVTFQGLRDALRGDLDAVTMKALEKEPEDRYQSALALIRDIKRHLEGRTVEARPHTRWYRTTKFVRRNALTVSLWTAAFMALGLGLAATTWQWNEARTQSALRQAAADRAVAAREFMVRVFEAFDPDELQGRTMTPSILIDQGLADVRTLDGRPDLQRAALNSLGQIALRLAETERADSIFGAALALPVADTAGAALDLAESMRGYAEILRNRREAEESVRLLRRALQLQSNQLPEGDPRLAVTMIDLAFSLYTMDQEEEASGLLDEAGTYDLSTLDEARRLQILADVHLATGRRDQAIRLYRRSVEAAQEGRGRDHPEVARTLLGLAAAQSFGDPASSESSYREAVRIFERSYGDEHVFRARALLGLSRALGTQEKHDEAASAALDAAAALDLEQHREFRLYGVARLQAARALLAGGDAAQAETILRGLIDRFTNSDYPPLMGVARLELTKALLDLGRSQEALATLDQLTMAEREALTQERMDQQVAELRERATAATHSQNP